MKLLLLLLPFVVFSQQFDNKTINGKLIFPKLAKVTQDLSNTNVFSSGPSHIDDEFDTGETVVVNSKSNTDDMFTITTNPLESNHQTTYLFKDEKGLIKASQQKNIFTTYKYDSKQRIITIKTFYPEYVDNYDDESDLSEVLLSYKSKPSIEEHIAYQNNNISKVILLKHEDESKKVKTTITELSYAYQENALVLKSEKLYQLNDYDKESNEFITTQIILNNFNVNNASLLYNFSQLTKEKTSGS